jgi:hypothetical protein
MTGQMPSRQTIAMDMLNRGERAERARQALAAALPDATSTAPDETGMFEITVEAGSYEDALQRVWDAVAAAGADDHVVIAEHPSLPEHWRRRVART